VTQEKPERPTSITFNSYQSFTQTTAINPNSETDLVYPVLGLGGETGEVQEKLKKFIRKGGDLNKLPEEFKEDLMLELGDVLWYAARIAFVCGYSLEEVATKNIIKLTDRKQRDVILGDGDTR